MIRDDDKRFKVTLSNDAKITVSPSMIFSRDLDVFPSSHKMIIKDHRGGYFHGWLMEGVWTW